MTHGRIAMRAFKSLGGLQIPVLRVPEKQTQTFKRGALVKMTSGYCEECGADPTLIAGIATEDGQNGASDGVKFQNIELIVPWVVYIGYIDTSASEGTGVSAATDRFKA